MPKEDRTCPTHSTPLKYSKKLKTWYCSECLQSAYQSYIAQQEAVKRYRSSDKGKTSQKKYEEGKGKTARQRYLKSDKYKQRRREYNQRLKESLQIARAAKLTRPSTEKAVERVRTEALSPLTQDIREYQDVMGKNPTVQEVQEWSTDVYDTILSTERAKTLIESATKRY